MCYVDGQTVSFEDIKRRLFLRERAENIEIPDHHYRLQCEKNFLGLTSTNEILLKGLGDLAAKYLEIKSNIIYVRDDKHNKWQNLITYIPPLVLQCALLHKLHPLKLKSKSEIRSYYNEFIIPNTRYTSLPSPNYAPLNALKNKNLGLYDLHVHLNGSTETDLIWQDYLISPDKILHELDQAAAHTKVREQLEQESRLLSPFSFYKKLCYARNIRRAIFNSLFKPTDFILAKKRASINSILDLNSPCAELGHPFRYLINSASAEDTTNISLEALMHLCVFNKLSATPNTNIGGLFHFYLLILGLANRLIVQQTHQYGFEQFQKLTLNGLREFSEREYEQRFLQMQGNSPTHINYLEGRISPKDDENALGKLLYKIELGWSAMVEKHNSINKDMDTTNSKLRIVVHFIKRADNLKNEIRHYDLRKDNWHRANVLWRLIRSHPSLTKRVCGVDAASSEFDTPPEVFAPLFRMMRRNGIKHFTYHAGEDFYHVLSGLRSIYEAIVFIELREGDRIGHSTAAGINIEQWMNILGKRLLIRKGEWLDNLIFAHHIIQEFDITDLNGKLVILELQILKIFTEIYDKQVTVTQAIDLWKLRKLCPILWFCNNAEDARLNSVFDQQEWTEILEERKKNHGLDELIYAYHIKQKNYNVVIDIETDEIFDSKELTILQKQVLRYMKQKMIVIETLPTSNVRIGIHKDYSTHQLINWAEWEKNGNTIPAVVMGTDDPGIFATNIYNEYAHIYCDQVFNKGATIADTTNLIMKINDDSKTYKF
jgi:adenosine deaminase